MSQEVDLLKSLYHQCYRNKDMVVGIRYLAICWCKAGKTIKEVSDLVFFKPRTIRAWLKLWDNREELQTKTRSGKPPRLTPEEVELLCQIVDKDDPESEGV